MSVRNQIIAKTPTQTVNTCLFCDRQFKDKFKFNDHIRQHVHENTCFCRICSSEHSNFLRRFIHEEGHLSKDFITTRKCPKCPERFKTLDSFKAHRKSHSEDLPYKCEICFKLFRYSKRLMHHMATHGITQNFNCDLCPSVFFNGEKLKAHVQRVHVKLKCDFCDVRPQSKYQLEVHLRRHTGEKPFKCNLCCKSFVDETQLVDHKRRSHTENLGRSFVCNICGKCVKTLQSLQQHHLAVHENRKPHECHICEKKFAQASQLKVHLRGHTGEKSHHCEICNKGFMFKGALAQHMKYHDGTLKQLKCDICPKTFRYSQSFKLHLKRHNNQKDEYCVICFKRFYSQGKVLSHVVSHINEKPWICFQCGKEYTSGGALKKHHKSLCN